MNSTASSASEIRGMSRWLGALGLAALVAASLAAQPAQAGQQITASSVLDRGTNAQTVKFRLNNGSEQHVYAGSFTTTFHTDSSYGAANTTSFETYCVDLSINLSSGSQTPADVSQTSITSFNDADGFSRNIGAAGWVISTYGDPNWDAATLASNLGLTLSGTWNDKLAEAAIQVAIWKAAYDSSSTDVSTGFLKFTSIDKNVKEVANKILSLRGTQIALTGFVDYPPSPNVTGSPNNQDQIFALPEGSFGVVPEPSTLAMAAFGGLIGLGMLGRKRLRDRKAQA